MYLLSDYYNFIATLTGASDVGALMDFDAATSVQSGTGSTIRLTLDLGSAKRVGAFWIKTDAANYALQSSDNGSTWVTRAMRTADAFRMLTVAVTSRYWRFNFSGQTTVSEVILGEMGYLFNKPKTRPTNSEQLPAVENLAWQKWDKSVVVIKRPSPQPVTTFRWGGLPQSEYETLRTLFRQRPDLVVFPRPEVEPDQFYRARFGPQFQFQPNIVPALGYTGGIELRRVA